MQTNILLEKSLFTPFGKFGIEDLKNALNNTLEKTNHTIKSVENNPISTWDSVIDSIYNSIYELNRMWGLVEHLLAVDDNKELRDLHSEFQPIINQFYVNLGQNHNIYQHCMNIKENVEEYTKLTEIQKKVLENQFRDFFLNGISLDEYSQKTFKDIQIKLGELSTKFEQNILDATDKFSKFVTLEDLEGVPADIINMYKSQANSDSKEGLYKITLQVPNYLPILQYASNRKLREDLYYSFVTRASEFGDKSHDNSQIILQIIQLRNQKAKLLKFKDYTEVSLYTKMAQNKQQVLELLYDLAKKSKPSAQNDINELVKFAKDTDNIDTLELWDVPYYSELLQQKKYNYSNEELRQYFQLPVVIDGLFNLIKQLYEVEFILNHDIPLWHKDMWAFNVNQNGVTIGYLYLDLFARSGKHSGAWMHSAQDRFDNSIGEKFLPQAYVVCNFTPPQANKKNVSLLTFDEVQTIFHEVGHAMHHLLTKITHFAISGINGVEWDAVELPSQFMEYFTWNYEILTTITKHVDNESQLPLDLYNKLLKSRFFQSGLHMLRQIEFALFDIILHSSSLSTPTDYLQILNDIRKQVAVVIPPQYNRFPNTFSHIFAGGYASGYYSYKWAEVLAADIFSKFDKADSKQDYANLGKYFLDTVLSVGGLNPMIKNFNAFMGRNPKIDALLNYSGIGF